MPPVPFLPFRSVQELRNGTELRGSLFVCRVHASSVFSGFSFVEISACFLCIWSVVVVPIFLLPLTRIVSNGTGVSGRLQGEERDGTERTSDPRNGTERILGNGGERPLGFDLPGISFKSRGDGARTPAIIANNFIQFHPDDQECY